MSRVMRGLRGGIGGRIAVAAVSVAVLAVAIVALGTLIVGAQSFVDLMTGAGHETSAAQAMFNESVGRVVVVALAAAILSAVVLSALLARRIAGPVRDVAAAARRVAAGDYAARVPHEGPDELASLADSFNQMASALQEQERLRREFIANAAHELRTPLTNLQGYLEAMRDGVIPADRAAFESLWEEAERLVRLSRSLDDLAEGDARTGPARLVAVDVAAAVRSAAELFGPSAASAGQSLSVEAPAALGGLADPDGLAQVLGNLLQNACRYTPTGGSIRVSAGRAGPELRVSVSNSGPGIPAGDLPHVFERFYRVEKSRDEELGGAGIGLAIVDQIIRSYGGRVAAESADGLTTFWFTLSPASP